MANYLENNEYERREKILAENQMLVRDKQYTQLGALMGISSGAARSYVLKGRKAAAKKTAAARPAVAPNSAVARALGAGGDVLASGQAAAEERLRALAMLVGIERAGKLVSDLRTDLLNKVRVS